MFRVQPYYRVPGELVAFGTKVAATTRWEILNAEGIDPHRPSSVTTRAVSRVRGTGSARCATGASP